MESRATLPPVEDATEVADRLQPAKAAPPLPPIGYATTHSLPLPPVVPATGRALLAQVARICRNGAPLMLTDLIVGSVCLLLASRLTSVILGPEEIGLASDRLILLLPALGTLLATFGLYPGIGIGPVVELRKLSLACVSLIAALLATSLALEQSFVAALAFSATLLLSLLVFLPFARAAARWVLARQSWWGEPVVIFGGGATGLRIHNQLRNDASRGLRSLGVIDQPHTQWRDSSNDEIDVIEESADYLGPPEAAADVIAENEVQWAVLASPSPDAASEPGAFAFDESESDDALEHDSFDELAVGGQAESTNFAELLANEHTQLCLSRIPNRILIGALSGPSLWAEANECGGAAAVQVGERLLMPWPRLLKRSLDIVLTIVVSVLASPLLLLLAIIVPLTSRGPILYNHERIGLDGRRFRVWKFRTMVRDADDSLSDTLDSSEALRVEWLRDHKLRVDPRVTRVGRFLRSTSLDELPQLWNVLRGEMSLVGPRPIIESEIAKYRHVYPSYTRVRPGITGWWQISGRNSTTYDQRIALDEYYVRNWSPWLDIYILARTIKTVLLREGAY